ncbi:hypothetical protein FALBO_2024 [Fusarium albosuccineum]|uniref:Dihydrodipicolinate synthetase n=1 Tax=Fusarium albosuccineum TaxID=1237068 RepID=A0A8H4LLQ9_9HYPO|nr:hypothetical protein FALBO_2024 [Fusarium albosuccineum]
MAPHSDAPSTVGFLGVQSYSQWYSSSRDSNLSDTVSSLGSSIDCSLDVRHSHLLIPGVYVPAMCFFTPDTEDVDTARIADHAVRLARAGVTGLATQGSNGEAVHLSHSKRQSTREIIQYCQEAWEVGGDYGLVLPPSYYATLFAPASETILESSTAVAGKSLIPLIIYNFPGAVGGMDLFSGIIVTLAAHPTIVGVKLTCGNTGKLTRVAAATRKLSIYNPAQPEFLAIAGPADFLIPSLSGGGHGILAGLANIAPTACIRTMELYQVGNVSEAQKMQEVVSQGDWAAIQGGVVDAKAGLHAWVGYRGSARSPFSKPSAEQAKRWKEGFRNLVMLE